MKTRRIRGLAGLPDRMERMFDILTHAARKTQIVILCCREAPFQGLGARRLTIEER